LADKQAFLASSSRSLALKLSMATDQPVGRFQLSRIDHFTSK